MRKIVNVNILICKMKQFNLSRVFITLIVLIFNINVLFGQEIQFTWNILPSIGKIDGVIIEKKGTQSYLRIKNNKKYKSFSKKIQKKDFDNLIVFLDNYEFPNKVDNLICDTIRIYYDTKFLPDSNWVYVNEDSLLINQLPLTKRNYYYEFDKNLKKCYSEFVKSKVFTGGTNFKGEYTKLNLTKHYNIYSAKLDVNDYKLNLIILYLVRKYLRKADSTLLEKLIVNSITPKLQESIKTQPQ